MFKFNFVFIFSFCIFTGSAECYTDSWMFRLALYHLPQTHRFDSSGPPLSSGSRGSPWLIPPQTIPFGSRTGDTECRIIILLRIFVMTAQSLVYSLSFIAMPQEAVISEQP